MKFLSQNYEKWFWECHYGSWGGPWVPKGCRDEKGSPRVIRWTPPQEGPQSGPKMGTFFCWSLRDTKKGGPGGPSKIEQFFGRCWGLPGGPQEGSRLDGSSIFTFFRTQKGLQHGSQNRAFWALKSELYSLWGTIWEKSGPKNGETKTDRNNALKKS